MLKRAKSRGNKYRLICAKGIFPSQRTFPNSELYITSRHFNENLPRRFSCPLNGVFDCFGAVRAPGNGIVFWVMATKKREYVKASSVVAKVVQGVRFLRCELCEGFCQTQSVFGGLRPSKHCLLPILDRVWRRRRSKKNARVRYWNCTFCDLKYDSNTFCPDSQAE